MKRPVSLLVAALAIGPAQAAEKPWIEVKSESFTVFSNSSEKSARQIAWQLEEVRTTFQKLWQGLGVETGKPFVAIAVRDEATLKTLLPAYWERKGGSRPTGMFVSGRDRHYVLTRTDLDRPDDANVNPYLSVYQGYASIVLQNSIDFPLPHWLHRGLMQLLGNTVVRDKDVLVGALIPWHFRTLAERPPTLRGVLEVDRAAYDAMDDTSSGLHNAAAWALTHYLMFGNGGANQPRFGQFDGITGQRTSPEQALREAYGPLEGLDGEFRGYVTRGLYTMQRAQLDIDVKADGFVARPLSPAEALAVQASFHVAMNRPAEASELIGAMRKANPGEVLAYEVEGLRLDALGKDDEAKAAYGSALEQGSTNAYAYYRFATLSWRGRLEKDALAKVRDALLRSVQLNPKYSWAQAQLAEAQAQLDAIGPALAAARRAVALAPGECYHRLSMARVLQRASQMEDAVREAGIGLTLARSDAERRAAQELLDFLKKSPRP